MFLSLNQEPIRVKPELSAWLWLFHQINVWTEAAAVSCPSLTCLCSHLGAEDSDRHFPQRRGVWSWLHLKQQVFLLPRRQFGRTEGGRERKDIFNSIKQPVSFPAVCWSSKLKRKTNRFTNSDGFVIKCYFDFQLHENIFMMETRESLLMTCFSQS